MTSQNGRRRISGALAGSAIAAALIMGVGAPAALADTTTETEAPAAPTTAASPTTRRAVVSRGGQPLAQGFDDARGVRAPRVPFEHQLPRRPAERITARRIIDERREPGHE